MLGLLVTVFLAQTPTSTTPPSAAPVAGALDALEHALVPSEPVSKLVGSTDDAELKRKHWSPDELRELHLANERASTAPLVTGVLLGILAGGGVVAADLLPRPASIWAGALSSGVIVGGLLLLSALTAPRQTFEVFGVVSRRTARLRKAALTESEWDPVVVDATNRVLTLGLDQTDLSLLEGETPLSDEAFDARISTNPEWKQLHQQSLAGSVGGLLVALTGLLVFAAAPVVVGALELPTLANVGVVAGGTVLGLLIVLGAQPILAAADAKRSRVLDEYNAGVFARARAAISPPVVPPIPSLEPVPPPPETPGDSAQVPPPAAQP